MRGQRLPAAVVVVVALTAVAVAASAQGRGRRDGAVARNNEAVTQAVRAQPALVPVTQRPGEQLALMAGVIALALVSGAAHRRSRRPRQGPAPWSPGRRVVHLRGPPLAVS